VIVFDSPQNARIESAPASGLKFECTLLFEFECTMSSLLAALTSVVSSKGKP